MSLRLKNAILFSLLTLIIVAMFSLFIYYSTVSIRKNAFYDRLWERVDIATLMLKEDARDLSKIAPSMRNKYWTILPEEEIVVYNQKREFFFINEYKPLVFDYDYIVEDVDNTGYYEEMHDLRQYVSKKVNIRGENFIIIVSARDKNGKRLLINLRSNLIFSFVIVFFLSALISWLYSYTTVKPVKNIIEAARAISATNLHKRVPTPSGRGEMYDLAITINQFLEKLEKSFVMQKSFVANASHQLRTPLTALMGSLEVTLVHPRTAEEYKAVVESALEDSKRMKSLINTLLIFAQASSAEFNINHLPIRIDELVVDISTELLKIYPGRVVQLVLSEDIADESQLIVMGNEKMIHQTILNIVENALKYSGESSTVVVRIKNADQHICIEVSDDGYGIAKEEMSRIFEPFYRSNLNKSVQGFGLGLTIARQIVESHGGRLEIESKINLGTKVRIFLPVGEASIS